MISMVFYTSIIIFWGIPIALGAGFWEVTAAYGLIALIIQVRNYNRRTK